MAATEGTLQGARGATSDVLVGPGWLEEHREDPTLVLVEVDVSPVAYGKGHIEGAVLWNVYRDLKGPDYRPVDTPAIERLLGRSGITPGSRVVFYGYAPAMGFWLMKLYGHPDVRVLDCARRTWEEEGRPWTTRVPEPVVTRYPLPEPDGRIRAHHSTVEERIDDAGCTVLDVRTASEYVGERFWPSGGFEEGGRPGHIPSAVHLSIEGLQDERGAFASAAQLRQLLAPLDLSGDGEVISYCTIGGRACTTWFALTYLLGRKNVKVYDGSWAEWGRMATKPVESVATNHH
jgi:thiosulfate/3-mercaptopyruvate sulfurtransferase